MLRLGTRAHAGACVQLWAGCATLLGCGGGGSPATRASSASPASASPPTWAGEVAALVYDHCVTCHRPGGSAPFSLLGYDDAARRAGKIAEMTERRIMPPWLPDPDVGDFAGDRRLAPGPIDVFRRWAAAGAPLGNAAAAPEPPRFSSAWSLGEPDLVVEFPADTVAAEGRDLYRNLVVRFPLQESRWVRALDLRPGNERVVHHARMMVDSTASSRELALEDAAEALEVMHVSGEAHDPPGFFLGWTPGKVPDAGRQDLAWRIDPGTDLVLQAHLRPSGRPEVIRPRAGFYFADSPPTRTPALVILRSVAIDIRPGDSAFVAEDAYRLPVEVEVLSIYPHAHYVGTRLEAWAAPPSGRRRDLIRISDWDFNWQDAYRYARPVRLPAGSILTMHYVYDNSAGNPRNPFDPPRRIGYGLASTDEMAELIVQVLPTEPGGLTALRSDLDGFYYQARLRAEATGLVYQARADARAERLDDALDLYRRSLRARNDASVMAEMADVLIRRGDAAAALVVARQAAGLAGGGDPSILGALARALAAAGQGDEAREIGRRALELARRTGPAALADSLSILVRSLGGPGTP